MKSNLAIFMFVAFLSSCTDQQVYESQRNSNKLECERLPSPQRDDCMKKIPLDYNKYEEERQKLLKERR